jgi:hypothetical protein
MGATPSDKEIMDAIEQSGYLMEQHIATRLEALGFHIRTNVPFEDQDEHKSREIDLVAIDRVAHNEKAKVSAFVELLVECKNNGNPFVFITRPKSARDKSESPQQFVYPRRYQSKKDPGGGKGLPHRLDGFFHLGFDKLHYSYLRDEKAVQFCRIDRKGGRWQANHDGLYDALFLPIAKAVTVRLAEVPKPNQSEWAYIWLLFPMVVVRGPLFVVDSGKPNPVPEAQDWVSFSRELKAGKLSGTYTLDFVREEALQKFVHDGIGRLSALAKELVETNADFLLRADCPWQE